MSEQHEESIKKVSGMYEEWFLDYASYVILERAIPSIFDGLKPVQRRILHSMRELEDGRYNKVANLVGNTMKYHPHGDAAITDAMVQIGQKEYLIDTQGNWGNILTGDSAAAARYIEARLTPFALEIVYNPKTTEWTSSYDGRNKEPINLPVKFPLLLAQGVEGIAVGLSTKILPHNFHELIDASIKYLKGKKFNLYPDFITGGYIDVSDYNDGERGGRVRVRAKIQQEDRNTLKITEIPFGTTTGSLIDSILKANDRGKIKIRKIEDNTSENVEVLVHLTTGVSPDKMIDALYAFTDCEISISPNACVINVDKPEFSTVSEILRRNTDHTVELLKKELEIELNELQEQWHFSSLERIFIENRIYHDIENEETWEGVINAIDDGLKPHIGHLMRKVTQDDIIRLTEIRIKRISKFDLDKAQQFIESIEDKIKKVKDNLENLIEFTINYFLDLKSKYGKGRERKTEIRVFENIDASKVAANNVRFYVDRKEGFIGTSMRRDEFLFECSDIDDIIIFRNDGVMMVTKVDQKTFVGKGIIHVAVWTRNDKRTIYNMIYRDGKNGPSYQKRFAVTSITRDREYDLTNSTKGSEVLYFSANPNGEAEVVQVYLRQNQRLKRLRLEVDFAKLAVRGRNTKGNLVTKYPIRKIELKEEGVSTLAPRKIWFDEIVKRLNAEERGQYLGAFRGSDKILTVNNNGEARLTTFELSNRYDDEFLILEKWKPNQPLTCVYYDDDRKRYYVKRFLLEDTLNPQPFFFSENPKSFIELVTTQQSPIVELIYPKIKGVTKNPETIDLEEFIVVRGIKAIGNQLTADKLKQVNLISEDDEIVEEETNESKNDEGEESLQPSLFDPNGQKDIENKE